MLAEYNFRRQPELPITWATVCDQRGTCIGIVILSFLISTSEFALGEECRSANLTASIG